MNAWLLPLLTFFPLVGALVILFLKPEQKNAIRWTAVITALISFALSIWVLLLFDPSNPNLQLNTNIPWIQVAGFNISFQMGVDGLSILLILLTTLLSLISIVASWEPIKEGVKTYMVFFLLLETGMLGVFLSLDLFLFYLFWEFSLVPMYFLIGVYGGERRIFAAIKFFLYTMAGSILMLLAILWLGIAGKSFSLVVLMQDVTSTVPLNIQIWLFLAFALAFAIKVPMWMLHSWLPDAHTEAPTAGSVILAGVLLKMGAYGFLRFNLELFPMVAVRLAPWIAGLAVVSILFGAIASFGQRDFKRLVAYSSISHMGFIILGLFALNSLGVQGSIIQMINHGVSTGALFLIVGIIYERRHTRDMDAFGGLWAVMPVYGALALIVSLSSMALPGLNGFIGEFTILLGAFESKALGSYFFAGVAAIGVILAAVYLLKMFQNVFLGPVKHEENRSLKDLTSLEILVLAPLIVLIFFIGLYPHPLFQLMGPTVDKLVSSLQVAAALAH
jgi:NADH-quinone oxidoreductase subunit M